MTYTITDHDSITKETVERKANADEIAQIEALQAKVIANKAEAEAKAAAKQAAQAKLAALGLTVEDLQALGL